MDGLVAPAETQDLDGEEPPPVETEDPAEATPTNESLGTTKSQPITLEEIEDEESKKEAHLEQIIDDALERHDSSRAARSPSNGK